MQPNHPGYLPYRQSNNPLSNQKPPTPPPFPVPFQAPFAQPGAILPAADLPKPCFPNQQNLGFSNFNPIPVPPSQNLFWVNPNLIPNPQNHPVPSSQKPNLPPMQPVPNYNQRVSQGADYSISSSERSVVIDPNQPIVHPQPPHANPYMNALPYQYGMNIPQPFYPNIQTSPSQKVLIDCHEDAKKIIESQNYHQGIAKKYQSCSIKILDKSIEVNALPQDTQSIKDELDVLINRFTFDQNPTWNYLENNGRYTSYEIAQSQLIEDAYKEYYPSLLESTYKNYSLKREINTKKGKYIVEFAKIGGVHRQVRKQANDTIRAVRREVNGVDLNRNFVLTYRWYWQHEDGDFRTYEDDAIYLIEESYIEYTSGQVGKSVALIQGSNGNTYKIDFFLMTQFNEITDTPRLIKRENI